METEVKKIRCEGCAKTIAMSKGAPIAAGTTGNQWLVSIKCPWCNAFTGISYPILTNTANSISI